MPAADRGGRDRAGSCGSCRRSGWPGRSPPGRPSAGWCTPRSARRAMGRQRSHRRSAWGRRRGHTLDEPAERRTDPANDDAEAADTDVQDPGAERDDGRDERDLEDPGQPPTALDRTVAGQTRRCRGARLDLDGDGSAGGRRTWPDVRLSVVAPSRHRWRLSHGGSCMVGARERRAESRVLGGAVRCTLAGSRA